MCAREYQSNFSELYPEAGGDVEGRRRKARTMRAVLADFYGGVEELKTLRLLDVGAGNGVIDHCLADDFSDVLGIDIDAAAIARAQRLPARENLAFRVGDAMQIDVENESFDVVLCAHVYEHVPSAQTLMSEIRRVLRPGGVCYFAAGNRFQLMEPHYRLPLLSVIPTPLAHLYLRALGRGRHYYEQHRSYRGLRRLVSGFRVCDYTLKLIREPERFELSYLLAPGSMKQRFAHSFARAAYAFIPTYIWLLLREEGRMQTAGSASAR